MEFGNFLERFMGMDEATWARHANPLSGWSRVSTLPLLAFAIWSRVWLGWHSVWLVLLVMLWIWINPRLFVPPDSHDAWMTQGVLGERIWLMRSSHAIPQHHEKVTRLLNIAAGLFILILGYGLWKLNFGLTIAGLLSAMGSKLWFLDRMVWLKNDTESNEVKSLHNQI